MAIRTSGDHSAPKTKPTLFFSAQGFVIIAAILAFVAGVAAAGSASADPQYRAISYPLRAGSAPPLNGGIFQADLNRPVNVIGWVETFGGCPDGDTGTWTITPPGNGIATGKVVGFGPIGNCPLNPPCDEAGPNAQGTLQCYGTLQYTLTQPIPCGQHDVLNATWQSSHGVNQPGNWTPAYIPLAVTHNYFGPCNASLPFGSGLAFSTGLPFGGSHPASPDATQSVALWRMGQSGLADSALVASGIPSSWTIIGQRDFDGDGYTDLLWREASSGALAIWFMNGFQVKSSAGIGSAPSNWSVYGTGNLNPNVDSGGNSPGTILWRDNTMGGLAIWFMSEGKVVSTANLGAVSLSWTIAGSDNHGKIFWQDTAGDVAVWQVTGSKIVSAAILAGGVPSNWKIVGIGDFYGDGNSGILWRDNTSGTVAIWRINGTTLQSAATVGTVTNAWTIVQTGDYNGDGKSDILWQDSNGNLAVWYMNGNQIASSAGLGNIGTSWFVQSLNSE